MSSNKAINRVFEYLKLKNIPHTRFEKSIGLSNGYLKTQLKRGADLGESILMKIIDNSLDLNPEWLLTGTGSMLKSNASLADTGTCNESLQDCLAKQELLVSDISMLKQSLQASLNYIKHLEKENSELLASLEKKQDATKYTSKDVRKS